MQLSPGLLQGKGDVQSGKHFFSTKVMCGMKNSCFNTSIQRAVIESAWGLFLSKELAEVRVIKQY